LPFTKEEHIHNLLKTTCHLSQFRSMLLYILKEQLLQHVYIRFPQTNSYNEAIAICGVQKESLAIRINVSRKQNNRFSPPKISLKIRKISPTNHIHIRVFSTFSSRVVKRVSQQIHVLHTCYVIKSRPNILITHSLNRVPHFPHSIAKRFLHNLIKGTSFCHSRKCRIAKISSGNWWPQTFSTVNQSVQPRWLRHITWITNLAHTPPQVTTYDLKAGKTSYGNLTMPNSKVTRSILQFLNLPFCDYHHGRTQFVLHHLIAFCPKGRWQKLGMFKPRRFIQFERI